MWRPIQKYFRKAIVFFGRIHCACLRPCYYFTTECSHQVTVTARPPFCRTNKGLPLARLKPLCLKTRAATVSGIRSSRAFTNNTSAKQTVTTDSNGLSRSGAVTFMYICYDDGVSTPPKRGALTVAPTKALTNAPTGSPTAALTPRAIPTPPLRHPPNLQSSHQLARRRQDRLARQLQHRWHDQGCSVRANTARTSLCD
jgi:hypothetical protein